MASHWVLRYQRLSRSCFGLGLGLGFGLGLCTCALVLSLCSGHRRECAVQRLRLRSISLHICVSPANGREFVARLFRLCVCVSVCVFQCVCVRANLGQRQMIQRLVGGAQLLLLLLLLVAALLLRLLMILRCVLRVVLLAKVRR